MSLGANPANIRHLLAKILQHQDNTTSMPSSIISSGCCATDPRTSFEILKMRLALLLVLLIASIARAHDYAMSCLDDKATTDWCNRVGGYSASRPSFAAKTPC